MSDYCEYCDSKATREYRGLTFCDSCAPDDSEAIGCMSCGNGIRQPRECLICHEDVCAGCARSCEAKGDYCAPMRMLLSVQEQARLERLA